ncbi:hypothetical protein G6F66_015262 [Rhizopus arrhizus]|nr:hypothetical protein G6F66_015262 [Rhizopus arrhizus]
MAPEAAPDQTPMPGSIPPGMAGRGRNPSSMKRTRAWRAALRGWPNGCRAWRRWASPTTRCQASTRRHRSVACCSSSAGVTATAGWSVSAWPTSTRPARSCVMRSR